MSTGNCFRKLALVFCVALSVASYASARKPNIVLIMTDDASWECFGPYGAEDYKTPNIDRMAAQGIKFNHCYSTPICTPSRVMIMTGQSSFRNYTHFGYLNPKDKTFGHMMQKEGYKTAIAGKWQLNGLYNAKEFDDSSDPVRPAKAGFDEWCLWQLTKGKNGPGGSERFWSPYLEHNGEVSTVEQNHGKYGPDIMSDFLVDFMRRHKDEPFFVYYPSVLVHDPFVPTPDTIGNSDRSQAANKRKSKKADKENFVAMVNYLDKIVGKLVKQVENIGQLDNTLFIFTSDNGTGNRIVSQWNGRTIKGGKGGMKDMGTHVPLVAYWKGHTPEGKVCDDLVEFTDVYPTLAEAVGYKLGDGDPYDGQSFLPQILGKATKARNWALCFYQPHWGPKGTGAFVRTADYKLYDDGRFYKVTKDLDEVKNLAGKISNENVMKVHKKLQSVVDVLPPVPKNAKKGGERTVHPDWQKLKH